MPTALTQPAQFGWQATQLNRIGEFALFEGHAGMRRTTSVTAPGNAMQRAAAPSSAQPRNFNDLTNLNCVSFPTSPLKNEQWQWPQFNANMILSSRRYQKGNRGNPHRP